MLRTKILTMFLSLFSFQLYSSLVQLIDIQTMAQKSDVVIHGRVGPKTVVKDKMGRLITLTQVEVLDGIHGAKTGDIVTVYQVGGIQNGVVMPMIGGQNFEPESEIIFFGLHNGDTIVSISAGLGKFDIQKNNLIIEEIGNVSAVIPGSNGRNVIKPVPLIYDDVNILKRELKKMIENKAKF